MHTFIPPTISSEALSGVILHNGELVYNTDDKKFYIGDGETQGGRPVVGDFASADGLASCSNVTKSNFEALAGMISQLQEQIFTLKQTAVETYDTVSGITDMTKDVVIAAETKVDPETLGASSTEIKGKTIQVDELEADSLAILMRAEDDVKISNMTTEGSLAKAVSNGNVVINTNGAVMIDNSTFGQNGYNCVEIGLSSSRPKSITITGIDFSAKFTNNVISVYDTIDGAVINITNCIFRDCSNPLRISNKSNCRLTINLVNCEFTQWEGDHAGGSMAYNGLCICQDYTSPTAEATVEANRFSPDKIKINIINCTHAGEKIAFDKQEDVCATADTNQLVYCYGDKVGIISYSPERYPQVTCI